MDGSKQSQVDEGQAAVLLGVTTAELRRLSRLSGVGHLERNEQGERLVFTHEELRRFCLMGVSSFD